MTGRGRSAGLDVGGSKIAGVSIDGANRIVATTRRPTPRGPGSQHGLIEAIVAVATELAPYDHLGIGVPGLVTINGVLRAAPNLDGIADLDIAGQVGAALGHDVLVDNDATCATVAEWQAGVAVGVDNMVLVTLGTGIGGGLVLDGAVRRGEHGYVGEYGHMIVDPTGPECPCGRRGCWERYASGAGLARMARQAMRANRAEAIGALAGGDPDAVRGEMVYAAARAGDPDATEIVDEFCRWVAVGLVNLANALDPALFVLGGGLTSGASVFLPQIRSWFQRLIYQPHVREIPSIEFAHWNELAGAVGAAMLHRVG